MFSTNQKLTHKLAKTKNLTSWLDFWLYFRFSFWLGIFLYKERMPSLEEHTCGKIQDCIERTLKIHVEKYLES